MPELTVVAFTPKGGCPLKHDQQPLGTIIVLSHPCSIHPQGWVPIETSLVALRSCRISRRWRVAFTPKGGCPLKRSHAVARVPPTRSRSIHPQGWVPIETRAARLERTVRAYQAIGSIHPQGWVPIETAFQEQSRHLLLETSSIHPQGWVPIETRLPPGGWAIYRAFSVAFTTKGGCPLKLATPRWR